jgi:hypothetical protein
MSKAKACDAPICLCTMHAVDGKNMSGVAVATIITSISSGPRPASLMALRAASVARSDVAVLSSALCLLDIPVRSLIQVSLVSTIFSRSRLVSVPSGTCEPMPIMPTPLGALRCGLVTNL